MLIDNSGCYGTLDHFRRRGYFTTVQDWKYWGGQEDRRSLVSPPLNITYKSSPNHWLLPPPVYCPLWHTRHHHKYLLVYQSSVGQYVPRGVGLMVVQLLDTFSTSSTLSLSSWDWHPCCYIALLCYNLFMLNYIGRTELVWVHNIF